MMIPYFVIGIVITIVVIALNWNDTEERFWMCVCCIPLVLVWPAFVITIAITALLVLLVN